MYSHSMRTVLPILILSAAPALLNGQAMVEYGAAAGSAGAAGTAAGKAVKGVLGQLNKTLANAASADDTSKLQAGSSPVISVGSAPAASAPAPAPAIPVDFKEIVAGMDKADLLKKAGKPSMSVTSVEYSALVETCWYRAGDDRVTVILRNGKVATVSAAK